jgi:hypothetical protein
MTTRLPTIAFLAALAIALTAAVPSSARAEDFPLSTLGLPAPGESQRPAPVSDENITLIWYRLAGKVPDFSAWAAMTDKVKKAPEYERQTVQAQEAAALLQSFNLILPGDQFIAELPATLSEYSLKNKGYLIENFSNETFVRFSHAGQNFGVVPRALMDHQWIDIDGLPAKQIDDLRHAAKNGKDVVMTLFLQPRSASPEPVKIDGADWRILSADIVGMAIFDDKGQALWRQKQAAQGGTAEQTKQNNELMHLYR